ncbi:threonine/serine dehydratase [Photobacterium sp. J15]|uniref:threonine/serine dehydratase n=1 Tax=Photobacterium sp. J15 TaxID=265901 RepID=UPI000AF7EF76|nr:threonine/serine dehydratase [Photobacterium sp. J15]
MNKFSQILQKSLTLNKNGFYTKKGVNKTPLIYSNVLSELCECDVYLKCENLQTTGSFKIRGATSALLNLNNNDKNNGVLTASSGNHGAGTAAAAKALNIPVKIYVPEKISNKKENKIAKFGAEIVKVDGSADYAEHVALNTAKETGENYISPYNHEDIIAGQGTLGQEILTQNSDIDTIIVSVGGGGLISGIGLTAKSINPELQLIGAFPENAPAMKVCMEKGQIVEVAEQDTLSDGTAGGIEPGSITLPICTAVVDQTVTVTETEIADAMQLIKDSHNMIIEGAAGVSVASLIKNKVQFKGKQVCIVICGGNVTDEMFDKAIQMVAK